MYEDDEILDDSDGKVWVRFYVDNVEYEAIETYKGWSVPPPTPPEKAGYEFLYWTSGYQNVQQDTICVAVYKARIVKSSVKFRTKNKDLKPLNNVIDCKVSQKLSGEWTLSFHVYDDTVNIGVTSPAPEAEVIVSDVVTQSDIIFKVTKITQTWTNNLHILGYECEHISFGIADIQIEHFEYKGKIAGAFSALVDASGVNIVVDGIQSDDDLDLYYENEKSVRDVLMFLVNSHFFEITYDNYNIVVTDFVGNLKRANILGEENKENVIDFTETYVSKDVNKNSITVNMAHRRSFELGDYVQTNVNNTPVMFELDARIVEIEWDPYDRDPCKIVIGTYIPDVSQIMNDNREKIEKNDERISKLEKKVSSLPSGGGSSGGGTSGGGSSGGWSVMSVDTLPDNPSNNVLYLIKR